MLNKNRKIWLAVFLITTLLMSLSLIVFNFFEGYKVLKVVLSSVLLMVLLMLVGVALRVNTNLQKLIKFFNEIAQGKTPEKVQIVGEMFNKIADSGLLITSNIRKASEFAQKIGEGDFSQPFEALGKEDTLGNALLQMKYQLVEVSRQENLRNWVTEGEANFAKLLRSSDDPSVLSDLIISELVKYLSANQGALYVVREDDLTITACYAYDRKKYINKEIAFGEGLVGQCYLEGEYIHMSEIPEGYMAITSGLGKASPRELIIMPLKVNEEIFGIVELASFNKFEPHMIDFLQKVGENIASSIASFKISVRTKRLLEESKEQQEMLQTQEEMMRQNIEEMQSTQEQISRKAKEYEKELERKEEEIARLKAQLNQV
jgi:hypothetical protein